MRMVRIVLALTLLVTLATVLLPAAAEVAGNVTVTGHVKGQDGHPKQFASVSLDGPGRYAAATNAEGVFTIPNVTPGRYTIRVRQGDQLAEFSREVGGSPLELIVKW
jgi:hypothetical protein